MREAQSAPASPLCSGATLPPRYQGSTMSAMAKNMTVRLDDDQAEVLEAISAADAIPMADVVRQAIDAHIAARRTDQAFQARLRASMERHKRILEKLAP